MREVVAGAKETPPVLDEVDASLHTANLGLQALMDLLAACPPAHRLGAAALRVLIQPLADQVEQAAQASRLLGGGRGSHLPPPVG